VGSPRVAAVLVNYKTPKDTLEAVSSLKANGYDNLEIIVVDNASDDGLAEMLSLEHLDVHLIRNEENLGFPGGCNVGIRKGLEMGTDYILLFNTDAIATPGMLREMVRIAESRPDIGILGPAVTMDNGTTTWYRGGTINRTLGYTRHPGMGEPLPPDGEDPAPTDFVTGCCMLIRREVFEAVGPLEEDYFLYVDDVEFSERARRAGFQVAYCPGVVAKHKVSATAGIRGTNVMTPLRAYYFARNMILFIRRHLGGWRRWTALQGQIYVRAVYRLLTMAIDGQLSSLVPYVKGMWHGLLGIRGKWDQHDRWAPS
jgi:GT2 family glycosyltransferase